MASLNDELGTLVERVREAEEGVATHRGEVETLREQATRSDHVIRQLRSQEEDLQAVLEARDSQIQVRVRGRRRGNGNESSGNTSYVLCAGIAKGTS